MAIYAGKLVIPVNFPCVVNGEKLEASFLESINHPLYPTFSVGFSNGYKDHFSIMESGFCVGDKESSKPYAYAIRNDLKALWSYAMDQHYFLLQYIISGVETNIWVFEEQTVEFGIVYKVYFGGSYHFELHKEKGKWFSRTRQVIEPEKIDPVLAAAITKHIDSALDVVNLGYVKN